MKRWLLENPMIGYCMAGLLALVLLVAGSTGLRWYETGGTWEDPCPSESQIRDWEARGLDVNAVWQGE